MMPPKTLNEKSLAAQVREIALAGKVNLPPLPAIARRIMEILADDNHADAETVAGAVRNDPVIVASVLKAANAALYAGLASVTDLRTAVSRVGLRRVGSLVLTLQQKAQYQTFRPERGEYLKTLWTHALASALAARALARQAGAEQEESYLAGLLHDIGMLLVLLSIDHLSLRERNLDIPPSTREELMKATHAELGSHVLSSWGIPGHLCAAVRHHHDDPDTISDELTLRMQAADVIAGRIAPDTLVRDETPLEEHWVIERLGMTEVELAALVVDVEEELERVRGII